MYRLGLMLCLLLIGVLLVALLGGHRLKISRALRIDGQLVCLVPNKQAAEKVRERLLAPARQAFGGQPVFAERWEDLDWPVGQYEVLTVEEAITRLRPLLTVVVTAAALSVEGQQAVILPDRDTAAKTLEALKARFLRPSDKLLAPQEFAQRVEISDLQVPPELVGRDISQAVARLLAGASFTRTHRAKAGDTAERLAQVLGIGVPELITRVPSLKQGTRAGEEITIKFQAPPVQVITVREVVVEKPYTLPPQEVVTPTLPSGERRVALEGKPGRKRVTEKQIWENDKLSRSVPLKGEILVEAVAGRVMVGAQPGTAGTAPALTPATP